MTPKLTEWFDGSKFVPAHVGVYERDYSSNSPHGGSGYAHFNGKTFSHGWGFVRLAELDTESKSSLQNISWRGLSVKP